MTRGILYIVATPIGNLGDITYRSIEILKSVSVVLSEDTRVTDKILRHFNINKVLLSYRDQNHVSIMPKIIEMLDQGQNLALVSDSGTPLISDPGFNLVRDLIEKNYDIVSVPGPSSVIASLAISGVPTDKFIFLGFLPRTKALRSRLLKEYGSKEASVIVFESPFRIFKLLEEILSTLGDRYVTLVNDLTKLHEKVTRGKVSDILAAKHLIKEKGEFIVLIAKEGFELNNGLI